MGEESHGLDAIEWAKKSVNFGAGELLITSMDRDGTKKGFDLSLTKNKLKRFNPYNCIWWSRKTRRFCRWI